MLKAVAQSTRSRSAPKAAPAAHGRRNQPVATKQRIVEAALTTLKREGFANTSARVIAATGGFNQALIFYHFGTLNDLLLAALDATSERRLQRYRELLADVRDLSQLVHVMRELYAEDMMDGHITAVLEMAGGSSSCTALGHAVVQRMFPSVDLAEEVATRLLAGSPFQDLVPARDLAFAAFALYFV